MILTSCNFEDVVTNMIANGELIKLINIITFLCIGLVVIWVIVMVLIIKNAIGVYKKK